MPRSQTVLYPSNQNDTTRGWSQPFLIQAGKWPLRWNKVPEKSSRNLDLAEVEDRQTLSEPLFRSEKWYQMERKALLYYDPFRATNYGEGHAPLRFDSYSHV